MATICFPLHSLSPSISKSPAVFSSSRPSSDYTSSKSSRSSFVPAQLFVCRRAAMVKNSNSNWTAQIVCMAPDEEKLTRRNPLDFPIEWERPKPGRRPDIFPQFSPMKTPLPPPLPYDPPEEDEEEEENKEEEEEDPEKEDTDKPENQWLPFKNW